MIEDCCKKQVILFFYVRFKLTWFWAAPSLEAWKYNFEIRDDSSPFTSPRIVSVETVSNYLAITGSR